MQNQLGGDYADFLQALQAPPVTSLRLNRSKLCNLPFEKALPIAWHPDGFFLSKRPAFVADPYFHAGGYYVQEASSMLLYNLIDFESDLTILDLCAAPGGKSTLLAAAMSENSLLIANDIVFKRAKILSENLSRWGNPRCIVTNSPPKAFARLKDNVDVLVIDAPCSGEGLFRKDDQAVSQWSTTNIKICASRQKKIIADSLPCLKKGGTLIYSTCTYASEENEEIVLWLLKSFPEIEIYPKEGLEKFGATSVNIAGVDHAAYHCYPHKFKGEGLFLTRLRRKGNFSINSKFPKESNKTPKNLQGFLKHTAGCEIVQQENKIYLQPKNIDFLQKGKLRTLKRGLYLGKMYNNFVPSHELALSILIDDSLPTLNLNYKDALCYLQKEVLELIPPIKRGWLLANYKGVNLGWLKATNGSLNNYYPITWRIVTLSVTHTSYKDS